MAGAMVKCVNIREVMVPMSAHITSVMFDHTSYKVSDAAWFTIRQLLFFQTVQVARILNFVKTELHQNTSSS